MPFSHLGKIIRDPKVVPMIRGKGFEYLVLRRLKQVINSSDWRTKKPRRNPQLDVRDVDILLRNRSNERRLSIECMMAGKGTLLKKDHTKFQVKCMRSRVIGESEAATRTARRYHVKRKLVLLHEDSCRTNDFDAVITSLENSLWTTKDEEYTFRGTRREFDALRDLFPKSFKKYNGESGFQKAVANFFLVARSKDLTVSEANGIT